MKKHKLSKRQIEASDKRKAAFHEAGHVVVVNHFGATAIAYIIRCGEPTREDKSHTGRTGFGGLSKFKSAVVAFGGLVTEHLAQTATDKWPDELLQDFEEYQELFFDGVFEFEGSDTDKEHCSHPQWRRALRMAWRIVVDNRREVERVAKILMRNVFDRRTHRKMECPRFEPRRPRATGLALFLSPVDFSGAASYQFY